MNRLAVNSARTKGSKYGNYSHSFDIRHWRANNFCLDERNMECGRFLDARVPMVTVNVARLVVLDSVGLDS